jgi:hypothetical protein
MKNKKPYTEMTTAELRKATEDLQGSILGKTRPLNAKERALWRKAGTHERGASRDQSARERINVSLDRGLLKEADRIAKEQGINRSQLIAQALAAVIGRKAG